jgi:hypothetical protein
MKQPVDHILRPQLPWRSDAGITECGYDASKVATLSRAEYFARLKDLGQQRSAMLTCMTCATTAGRWKTWEQDPRHALEREIVWETAWRGNDRGRLLQDELVVIADLVAANREQFEASLTELQQRRAWNDQKAQLARTRPATAKPRGL